jgi:hypothetical protein
MSLPRTPLLDTTIFVPCAECERLLEVVAHAEPGPAATSVAHALSLHIVSAHSGAILGGVSWLANHLGPRIATIRVGGS